MKFFVALSANILITAIVVFLCYAAATTPTSTYLVAGLVVCFLSSCYLSRKIFFKILVANAGLQHPVRPCVCLLRVVFDIEFSGFVMCRLLFRRIQSCRAKMFQ